MDGTLRDAVKWTRELDRQATTQVDKFSPPREPDLDKEVKRLSMKHNKY